MDLIYFDYYVGIGLRGCKIMYVWDKGLFCLFYWKNEYNMLMYISIEGLWVKLFIWIIVNIVFFVENCKENFIWKCLYF